MKKYLFLAVMILLTVFCGCSNAVKMLDGNEEVQDFPDYIIEYAETVLEGKPDQEIGTGIYLNRISEDGSIQKSGTTLFPVYENEKLCALIVSGEDEELIEDENMADKLADVSEQCMFMLDTYGQMIICVDGKNTVILSDNAYELDEFEKESIVKLQKKSIKVTALGKKRIKLDTVSGNTVKGPDGVVYSADRIVIRFTEGDLENKKEMFEEFCQGTYKSGIKSQNICVFKVQPASYSKLAELVSAAEELDYVDSCWLDKVKQQHESSSNANREADK